MTVKQLAPYGTWPSPISVDAVIHKTRNLTSPRVSRRTGRAYFVESTSQGRQTIIEVTRGGSLRDVLPDEYSVQNRVYEYGGSKYDVLPDGRIIFSNRDDTVRLVDPDTGDVSLVLASPASRYSSFCSSSTAPRVLAIEEDHTFDEPSRVRNYLVAINVRTGAAKRVAAGADFYFIPQCSWDGTRVSWVEWNHPDLPFTAGRLFVADWAADGTVENARLVAGDQRESVAEPRWGPDGSLFFAKEEGPYRKIYRLRPGAESQEEIRLPGLDDAEFGEAGLGEGSRTFVPLSKDVLAASAVTRGVGRLIAIDVTTGSWHYLIGPDQLCHMSGDAMARLDDASVMVIGSGTGSHQAVHVIKVADARGNKVVRESTDEHFPALCYSRPEPLRIRSAGTTRRRHIHGFLWMPRNARFAAPPSDLPPLIVSVHGGPTGRAGSGLDLRTQFFTSRGYALLQLNYTGSTGHGRECRESLFGRWGVVDADDVVEAARHLASRGRVKHGAVGVTGASAGGYTALQCLSRHAGSFAAGVCVCGISDLESLGRATHKLESHYTELLVLGDGAGAGAGADEKRRIYRDRSAVHRAGAVTAPLLLLHGQADTVVPVEQARVMAAALRALGRDVDIVEVAGEGHTFAKPSSAEVWLVEEERWWREKLLRGGEGAPA
ncbi:uncharacterized protein UV8b_01652 [Ustilaginoidea virens]|uniref:Peptidase S9 prolyl oligopeptidase catalytic domain-containing protein n=1 Tax=Ustilaginoidea virens TaxID=1159556 RepID=A0A8E5HL19_USTVR|nr:uncharacterized protein UV8b_01652 [Ustilaginoidea virens]QUC17411.1 hypothetical protein UV8b_01652 [Ustilaginoidea virens]